MPKDYLAFSHSAHWIFRYSAIVVETEHLLAFTIAASAGVGFQKIGSLESAAIEIPIGCQGGFTLLGGLRFSFQHTSSRHCGKAVETSIKPGPTQTAKNRTMPIPLESRTLRSHTAKGRGCWAESWLHNGLRFDRCRFVPPDGCSRHPVGSFIVTVSIRLACRNYGYRHNVSCAPCAYIRAVPAAAGG